MRSAQISAMDNKQIITLYLGNDLYGIDILRIREIYPYKELTEVEDAPPYIQGLLNIRGQIVAVINLAYRLGLDDSQPKSANGDSLCVVLKNRLELAKTHEINLESAPMETVALSVDRIGDILNIDQGKISVPPPSLDQVEAKFLEGVIKMEQDLLLLLKLSEILDLKKANIE